MSYSYTLLSDLQPDPPIFKSRKSMAKHFYMNVSTDAIKAGVIIDANGASFNFTDPEEVRSFLTVDDSDDNDTE